MVNIYCHYEGICCFHLQGLLVWRYRQQGSQKCQQISNKLHNATSQKTVIFIQYMDWIHCLSTTIKIYLKEIWCPVSHSFSLNNVNILKTSTTNYLTSTSYTFRICIWKIKKKKSDMQNTGELLPTQTARCHITIEESVETFMRYLRNNTCLPQQVAEVHAIMKKVTTT